MGGRMESNNRGNISYPAGKSCFVTERNVYLKLNEAFICDKRASGV